MRSVLRVRTILHAHAYAPVFSIVLFAFTQAYAGGVVDSNSSNWIVRAPESVAGALASIGSLIFGISKFFTGRFTDRSSPFTSVQVGLVGTVLGTGVASAACFLALREPFAGFCLIVIAQVILGIGLAFIDVADGLMQYREMIAAGIGPEDSQATILEAAGTIRRSIGMGIAAFVGSLVFLLVVARANPTSKSLVGGGAVFAITCAAQIGTLIYLSRQKSVLAEAARRASPSARKAYKFRDAWRLIRTDEHATPWVVILALLEGWFLFLQVLFSLRFLRHLLETHVQPTGFDLLSRELRLVVCAVLFSLPLLLGSVGSKLFQRWARKHVKPTRQVTTVQDRDEIMEQNDRYRFAAALFLLLVAVMAVVVHAFVVTLGRWPDIGDYLLVCAVYVLRGFANPLTTKALRDRVAMRAEHLVATCGSLAVSIARSAHFVAAGLFLVVGIWVKGNAVDAANAHSSEPKVLQEVLTLSLMAALSATTIIVALFLSRARFHLRERLAARLDLLFRRIGGVWRAKESRIQLMFAAFATCLVMSNVLGIKLQDFGWLSADGGAGVLRYNAGAVAYALACLLVPVILEVSDSTAGIRLWATGIGSIAAAIMLFAVARLISPEFHNAVQSASLFDGMIWVLVGSLCSFAVSNIFDIWLFHKLRAITGGGLFTTRCLLATFATQAVDTSIFIGVASIGWHGRSPHLLADCVVGQLIAKWVVAVVFFWAPDLLRKFATSRSSGALT